jgi:hypothetical protein
LESDDALPHEAVRYGNKPVNNHKGRWPMRRPLLNPLATRANGAAVDALNRDVLNRVALDRVASRCGRWLRVGCLGAGVWMTGLFGGGALSAGDRPPATKLFPENSIFYARIHDANELRDAFSNSSFGKLAQEKEIEGLVRQLYGAASEAMREVETELGVGLDDMLAIPQGEVAVAVFPTEGYRMPGGNANFNAEKGADAGNVTEGNVTEGKGTDGGGDAKPAEGEKKDNSPEAIRKRLEAKQAREQSERQSQPSPVDVVLMIEAKEQMPNLMALVDKAEEENNNERTKRSEIDVRGTQIVAFTLEGSDLPIGSYCERDGVLLVSNATSGIESVLARWDSMPNQSTLAQRSEFTTLMARCTGTEDARPQGTLFFNPDELTKMLAKEQPMTKFVIDQLGLDGVQGIAASMFIGGEQFESVVHAHIGLEGDRKGILSVLQPVRGQLTPEVWVPADVASYVSLRWSFDKTFGAIERLVDKFTSEGMFQKMVVDSANAELGVNLRDDLIGALGERVTVMTWMEPPSRINSQASLIAIELEDPEQFRLTIGKLMEKLRNSGNPGALKETTFSGATVYQTEQPVGGDDGFPMELRPVRPTVAVVDNCLMYSDSEALMQKVILNAGGAGEDSLVDQDVYRTISEEVQKQLGEQEPIMFAISRPEVTLRTIYDMAVDGKNQETLASLGEEDRFFKVLSDALKDNPLPPYAVIERHMAPTGAFAYDDPTGMHYMAFGMKPAAAKEN